MWKGYPSEDPELLRERQEAEQRQQEQEHHYQIHMETIAETCSNIGNIVYGLTLIGKHMSYKEEFEAWLKTKPQEVQDLAAKYPPGDYTIKEGAPYGITVPGSKVNIESYREDGTVGVRIKGTDKSEQAIEHEKMLGARYNKSEEEMEKIHVMDIMAHVEPEWLELVHNEAE